MFVKRALAVMLAGTASVAGIGVAEAQTGTPAASLTKAGTQIDNVATVKYTVNGTDQTTESTKASFVVDRKVNFTVETDQTGFTKVTLSQQDAVTRFKVTNLTNDAQDFLLDPDQQNISVGIFPGTDNFDLSGLKAYVDVNGDGIYQADIDTKTYIDELQPDQSATVFIVGNVPSTSTAKLAFDSLHVIVAEGGTSGTKGSALIATDLNIGNADNFVDVVFSDGDSDGDWLGDIARNGQGRAYSGYEVLINNVALTVAKSAKVIADGVNTANFKAIPGATVEYCLRVNNATLGTSASNVTLTDAIPANTTYVPGSLSIGTPGLLGVACVVNGTAQDDATSFDGSKVTAKIASLAGGTTMAAAFQVTIK